MNVKDLILLRFEEDIYNPQNMVARTHEGKVCLLDNDQAILPRHGQVWECEVLKVTPRFLFVAPVQQYVKVTVI